MSETFQIGVGDRDYSGRSTPPDDLASDAPVVVAIHGGTYTSGYFDIANYSLFDRAAERGVRLIAVDRPGYGASTKLPDAADLLHRNALLLSEQIPSIVSALGGSPDRVFIIGHSMGGAIAITIASLRPTWLTGIACSGIGVVVPPGLGDAFAGLPQEEFVTLPTPMKDDVMFGPPDSFSDDMPAASHPANTTVPLSELFDVTSGWTSRFQALARDVVVPVHYRQAEFDHLWMTDDTIVDDFARSFQGSERVDAALLPGVGHCIDFHLVGNAFHDAQLDFALGCIG